MCYIDWQNALVTIGAHSVVHMVEKFTIYRYNQGFLNMLVNVLTVLIYNAQQWNETTEY